MNKKSKIYVAGHRGLVGSAIIRQLEKKGFSNLLTRTHLELDLNRQTEVEDFFKEEKPEYVFLAAAKVGGIHANNTYRADFIYQNLQIQNNIIHQSYVNSVKRLLFLGSSCIYPKLCPQPMKEEYLLSGYLDPTNEPYAIAKIAGIKMCEAYNKQYGTDFRSVMPTNLYGPNDNFDLKNSHVLPALIRKFHEAKTQEAKEVTIWGTGQPRREFLYVDDMAEACLFVMGLEHNPGMLNIGVGEDVTICELAEMIRGVIGFEGKLNFDTTKSDGTPQKLLSVSKLQFLGWQAKIPLSKGICRTYDSFFNNQTHEQT